MSRRSKPKWQKVAKVNTVKSRSQEKKNPKNGSIRPGGKNGISEMLRKEKEKEKQKAEKKQEVQILVDGFLKRLPSTINFHDRIIVGAIFGALRDSKIESQQTKIPIETLICFRRGLNSNSPVIDRVKIQEGFERLVS